jgi:hypothetical protein
MEDLPEAEWRALEKEAEEEMVKAMRRKLACFQKTRTGVIKKAIPAITTTTIATPTVTPNFTPEELVKFMYVAVASKYGNNLMNFTHTMTEEVRSTLDTFKTDLQNMLPQQIRSVVQQVHGESQGKQPDLEPSTPYPSGTSAPGNTGTLYPGNTTSSCNPGNIASISTSHLGNTAGNVIYVDASAPYPGGVSMGNLGTSPTANLPYPGDASASGNLRFPTHTTPHRPTQTRTFSNYITKPWLTVPTYLPQVRVFLTVLSPTYFFPMTPAYVTPNPRVEAEVNDGVRDQITWYTEGLG